MTTQATKSNPEEKIYYKHLVLACWHGKFDPKVRIDCFLPLQWSEEMDDMEKAEIILDGKQPRRGLGPEEKNAINGMLLRSRYADQLIGGGLLVFDSDSKLEAEDIEAYLNSLPPEKLEATVGEATVF